MSSEYGSTQISWTTRKRWRGTNLESILKISLDPMISREPLRPLAPFRSACTDAEALCLNVEI
jgi:hypothetical protein